MREDSEGKVHVGNCTAVTIDTDTHEHLQGLIDKAFSRRKFAATAANEASHALTHSARLNSLPVSVVSLL